MHSTHMLGRFRAAVLAATGAPALAGSAREAADKSLGMAIMTAVVDEEGNLIRGHGATGSAYNATSKFYIVTFARPVTRCVSLATTYNTNFANSTPVDFPTPSSVRVEIYRTSGGITSQGFQLLVYCAE